MQHPSTDIQAAIPDRPQFLVTGVPRGGTSAMATALNLHPKVLCAFERFTWPLHSAVYPFTLQDMLDPRVGDKMFHQRTLDIIRTKRHVTALGNKKPEYYVTLHDLLARCPAKVLVVHRDPAPTAASWNVRADNEQDKHWSSGHVGMYAFLAYVQMLICLRALPPGCEYLCVDYRSLFWDQGKADVLGAVYEFLGVPAAPEALGAFEKQQRKTLAKLSGVERGLRGFEAAYYEAHGLGALHAVFREQGIMTPEELAPHLNAFLDQLGTTDFLDDFFAALPRYGSPAALKALNGQILSLHANAGERSVFSAYASGLRTPGLRRIVAKMADYGDTRMPPLRSAEPLVRHAESRVERFPLDPGSHIYLGDALMCLNRFEEAKAAYKEAARLAPRHAGARERILRVMSRLCRRAEAGRAPDGQ